MSNVSASEEDVAMIKKMQRNDALRNIEMTATTDWKRKIKFCQ